MVNNKADLIWLRYETAVCEALDRHHYLKASTIIKEALEDARKTSAPEPKLLNSADALASLHIEQGDFQSAAALYRLSLEVKKNTFGPTHPDVEQTMKAFKQVLAEAGGLIPNKETTLAKS